MTRENKKANEDEQHIVTIGGGTGHFTLLSGLKTYPVHITAIVSMADDGGSTGVLRDEMGVLPPGDVRQCLVALSEETALMRSLFSYRFERGGLSGHTFGNLFLSALEKITGSFPEAIEEARRILRIKGDVAPVSEMPMRIIVELNDGSEALGEKALDADPRVADVGVKSIRLTNRVSAHRHALEAIAHADTIVIGPGDLYGSIIPNFLVNGIPETIQKSKATVVYILNLTNKKGQTEKFGLAEYVSAIEKYIGRGRIDIVVGNTKEPDPEILRRYEEQEGGDMFVRCPKKGSESYVLVCADVLSDVEPVLINGDAIGNNRSFIRHDPKKLVREIMHAVRDARV